MNEPFLAHRFQSISTLDDSRGIRLDVARDVASQAEGLALTIIGKNGAALESAARFRLGWFGHRPLMRQWEVRARAADEHGLTLFLNPHPGEVWTDAAAALSDQQLADDLRAMREAASTLASLGSPVGGLSLRSLYRDEKGPYFLPSAAILPPHLERPQRSLPHQLDPWSCEQELVRLETEVNQWRQRHRPQVSWEGWDLAVNWPQPEWLTALDELGESGGVVVARGRSQLGDDDLAAVARWAADSGRPLFVLLPHFRPANIPKRTPQGAAAVVVVDGIATYAAMAEGWSSLQAAGWIDGREILIAVVREPLDEAARLYVSSLLHRGRDRLREANLAPHADSMGSTPEGNARRVVEALSVAERPLGDATLREVCGLDGGGLVDAVMELDDHVEILCGRVDEGPSRPQLVVGLRPGHQVELDPARETEVRRLLAATVEAIPGRGIGRGWLLFDAMLSAKSRRAAGAARKLATRADKSSLPLLEFAVHHRLAHSPELTLRLEDRCRGAISMGKQYMLRGELEAAEQIFAEALRRLDTDASHRLNSLAVELILWTSRLAQRREDPTEGDRLLSQAIERYRDELPVEQRASLYLEHSKLLGELGRDREAAARAELTLRIVTPERHPAQTAEAHFRLGVCHYRASRYSESVLEFQRSLVLWEQEGEDLEASRAYNNLSLNYRNMGRLKDAERCLRRSLELKSKVGDSRLLLGGRLNLGYLALDQLNFAEARESGEESLRLARSLRDRMIEAEAYGLLGEAAIGEERFDEARQLLLKDLEICREVHHDRERLPTLRRLVALLLKLNEIDGAAGFLEEARSTLDTVPSRYEAAMLDLLEADLLERSGAQRPALEAATAAAHGFAALNRFDLQVEALTQRASLERATHSARTARETLAEIQQLIDRHEIHRVPQAFYALQGELGQLELASPAAMPWLEETTRLLGFALEGTDGIPQMVTLLAETLRAESVFLLDGSGTPALALVRGVFGSGQPLDEVVDQLAVAQVGAIEQPQWMAQSIPASRMKWIVVQRVETGWTEDQRTFLRLVAAALGLAGRSVSSIPPDAIPTGESPAPGLVGQSPAIREVLRMVDIVKDNDVTILLLGENGTGKDLVARAIHESSPRGDRALVAINCASIPSSLLESQLFGHEKGAFTSAHEQHVGVFERAHGGTIHLDEIGEMDLAMQAKLLRVLQERSFTRVGGTQTIHTDVRVVAATNRNLAQEVEAGRFRTDLYYRLNVITIVIPPLRERGDDIALLADHFVERFGREFRRPVRRIAPDAVARLKEHAWPGNVRELENVIKNAIVFCDDEVLRVEDLPDAILQTEASSQQRHQSVEEAVRGMLEAQDPSEDRPLMPRVELLMAHEAVRLLGNKTKAAKLLGITKPTLYNRLKRFEALYGARASLPGRRGGGDQGGP